MKTTTNIVVTIFGLVAALGAFGVVLAFWSDGYAPRWPEENGIYRGSHPLMGKPSENPWPDPRDLRYRPPAERFEFPDITDDGDLRLVIAPSFGHAVSVTITKEVDSALVVTREYTTEWGREPVQRRFRRQISVSDHAALVRRIYALGFYDEKEPEMAQSNDGITVMFMTIVDGHYYWQAGKRGDPQYDGLVQLFFSACGDACDARTLGKHRFHN